MLFDFDMRTADSPHIAYIWRTTSANLSEQTFISSAETHWEIVVTKQSGKVSFTIRGPETVASPAPIPQEAEFFGIVFKPGTFMVPIPNRDLVNDAIHLPDVSSRTFMLHGTVWELPTYDHAEIFVEWLLRSETIAHDPLIPQILAGEVADLSARSVQRRFLHATGLTQGTYFQIERAKRAQQLLSEGVPILDVVEQAGYADQPHLTRSMRRFIGLTPARIQPLNSQS